LILGAHPLAVVIVVMIVGRMSAPVLTLVPFLVGVDIGVLLSVEEAAVVGLLRPFRVASPACRARSLLRYT